MKTRQRQFFWRLGRWAFGLQVIMLMLVMLAGASPTWADETWDKTNNKDDGGGTYRYKGEGYKHNTLMTLSDMSDNGHFKTLQRFDAEKDQFWWNFEVRVNYFKPVLGLSHTALQEYKGDIYVITADDVSHKIATWSKEWGESSYTPYDKVDKTWGEVYVSNIYDYPSDGFIKVGYTPTDRAIKDGVKRIIMRQDITARIPNFSINEYGWVQYEKDLDLSSIAADKPMTKLSVEWDDNGQLAAKATGVPDKRKNDKWDYQFYKVKAFYYDGSGHSYEGTFTSKDKWVNCVDGNNNKMDMNFSFLPQALANRVYTVPVYIKYSGGMKVNPASETTKKSIELNQPEADIVEVKPFTRPTRAWVEYDQWTKKNVIRWERQKKERGHNGSRETTVDCLTDGKWYVIRYTKGGSVTDYKKLDHELNGNATTLEVTDEDIDYDKNYVYRVIFLPDILESKYKDKLASLPGSQSKGDYNLWLEAEVNTKLSAQVKLSHDKTYTSAVRLVWEYDIQASGLEWSIDYRDASSDGTWLTKPDKISVDPKNTTAEVKYDGSVCDLKEYRVRTSLNGREICSNILSANLPAGTMISEVKASTGTEENTVIVKWKVTRPDKDHDIYYRVRRRIVGEDETKWVTLTNEIHGTASEYEYTDTRPLAGTYYEYCVEAFGAMCDEQLQQTSEKIAPGFSQARGTITGHISFGSGTAVQGVRVDLVKTSSDDETSASQFLSRYISGNGLGLQWTADSAKYVNTLNGTNPITLQLWAKPQSTDNIDDYRQLLELAGGLEIGVKSGNNGIYHLYAIDRSNGGTTRKEFPKLVFDNLDFTHIAAVYDKMQWKFYVGNDSLLVDSMTVASSGWNAVSASHGDHASTPTMSFGGSNRVSGSSAYQGYVDDIRLWLRALTRQEIESNYTRILGGTEKGLTLYWPLDEGEAVKEYAFDIARQDGIYQENHPTVGANVNPKLEKPSLLKLYGVTDSEGD